MLFLLVCLLCRFSLYCTEPVQPHYAGSSFCKEMPKNSHFIIPQKLDFHFQPLSSNSQDHQVLTSFAYLLPNPYSGSVVVTGGNELLYASDFDSLHR